MRLLPLPLLLLVAALAAALPAQTTTLEQPLPADSGWHAALIHRAGGGVWYARVAQAIGAYGAPELLICDDLGRITVLSVYSGKWTARSTNPDNQWLAPSMPADVDPRVSGREIYAGGRAGNLHRVLLRSLANGQFALDSVEIAHVPGEEFHTVLAADLDPARPGDELLAFAISGAVFQLLPDLRDGDPGSAIFTLVRVAALPGRVRDALVLPGQEGLAPAIIAVSRTGDVLLLRLDDRRLDHRVIAHEAMGLGRIARRPPGTGTEVLYVTRDDGVVLRLEQQPDGSFRREPIYAGDQGLRGIAAGRFDADPARESVAVYGYGRKVQIVSRAGSGPWQVETVFAGPDQGHWLTAGEFDGRNGTDELIATGFGGQVLLLSRPPGYALPGVAVDAPAPAVERGTSDRPWRIAVKASTAAVEELSPLCYQGGFETKSMVYETLVRRGGDGRIVPGLAAAWRIEEGGRTFIFRLREGATFHDGQPVTAADVALHFRRWVGLPEHAWLRCNDRITEVRAMSPQELRIRLDRSYALLPDLCAINPTAIRGPGALDREGRFVAPIGSGPFALQAVLEDGRVLRYRRHRAGPARFVDLVRLDKTPADDPLDALLRGEVDAVIGSWLVRVDPARAVTLRRDPRFSVIDAPGSSMTYLGLRCDDGPTADRALRRRIAAAIDRDELIAVCEHGLADASTGWAAPSVTIWPQGQPPRDSGGPILLERPLRIAVGCTGSRRALLAATIAGQLTRAGIPTEVATEDADGWDLRIEVTHGVPYDPYTTAVDRFLPLPDQRQAQTPRFTETVSELVELMRKVCATADQEARCRRYAEVQAVIDGEAVVVPLFAPRRIAVLRAGMPAPDLDHDMYTLDARWLTDAE